MRHLLALVVVALAPLASPAIAQPDWGTPVDPFNPKEVATYKAILGRNPHDATALAKLLEKYRRYRTVDLLKDEYGKQLAKTPDDWATLVVLGHLHRKTGDDPRALEMWTRAVAKNEADAATWLAIGELNKGGGKNKEARAAYDKALAHATVKDMKKRALRALADLALATNDIDSANNYFKQFLDLDPNNAQLWIERGDAMLAAQRREVALESYAAAEKLLGSDPSRRVEVVARRGQALEGLGKDDDAISEYRRAIKLAPKGYYLEVELTGRIIDIYRRKQALPALLTQYEKEWPEGARGHFEWATLGKLYEETGAQDKAINALKKAVAKAAWELDTQRRLIQLLENSGRDDEALAQYEAVVRAAPGEARFQLDLADRYQRRGQEKKALDVLARLQQRFPADVGVLSAIADLYQRWGKEDLAIAQYERLAKLEPDDPAHLVTLGEQYWQKNDKARALATWKRITASGKASAFAKLGDVMAEHGNRSEALANYAKAIKLDDKNPDYYRGRAQVYEMDKLWADAVADWEKVLSLLTTKVTDRMARRDARRKLVAAVVKWGAKEQQYKRKWSDGFSANDIEAGYFLVEYFRKRPEREQPLKTLELLRKRVTDDQEILLELAKEYQQTKPARYDDAVALLLEVAKAAPSREREMYTMIADIKTLARKDDEATEWRMKAVAKSPRDPTGYIALAEGFVSMQRTDDAVAAYEKALQIDPRISKAQFALAQLYVQNGKPARAAELLRAVLRTSTSDEDIQRAAREAIALEEITDSLGELEKVLAPLSFMMAHKPVYRRMLVDLYVRYVPRLVERQRHGNEEVRKAARTELQRLGGHGLQPLLEALRDDKDTSQQRVAVTVLGHLGNKGAAAALVHLARQEPTGRSVGTLIESVDREVRVDALIAAGRLGDPSVITDVLPLIEHPELTMREAATFTLGRTADRRAAPALIGRLADRKPSVQGLACLGLAQIDDPKVVPALIGVLADARRADATRAACAYALGVRRAPAGVPALLSAIADNRGETQRLAAWSLGQIGDPKTLGPLMRAYFARAGRSSDELVWAIGRVAGGMPPLAVSTLADFPLAGGKYDPRAALNLLPGELVRPPTATKLIVDHADDIAKGLLEALAEHRDVVISVLADLDGSRDELALGGLVIAPDNGANTAKLAAALAKIGEAISPAIIPQLTSEDPKVRALTVSVIAKIDGGKLRAANTAVSAIDKALADPADQVRAAAMTAIPVLARRRGNPEPHHVAALSKTLGRAGGWADQRVAALALGRLGAAGNPAAVIKQAADPSAFVREAVAMALGDLAAMPTAIEPLLALSRDDVPQVRAAAGRSLAAVRDERAAKRRGELAKDPSQLVRDAIKP